MLDRKDVFQGPQCRICIKQQVQECRAVDFFDVLTGPELLEMTDSLLPEHRERLYPPTVALSMFIKQALEEDRSCQRAVNAWAAQRAAEGLSVQSVRTGAYCRARGRLPLPMISALTRATGRLLSERAVEDWRWRGRRVKLADGTGISMPDTQASQARFPQPSTQAEGVGFPLARLVGIICLSAGAVLEAAIGPHAGKGHSELDLFRSLMPALLAGDVLLADALYCNCFLVAMLQAAGVDGLFEQHGARITDFRRGESLGTRDHIVSWIKPAARPKWMSGEQYAAFPDTVTVRELRVGGHTLVTTLLEPRTADKCELGRLCAQRWHIELDLRCIKTTLRMETSSCKTPAMVQREPWVYLLAYNLIRLLMAQAASIAGVPPRTLSFKHTVQMWLTWTAQIASMTIPSHSPLFRLIGQLRVANRPRRIEPRERKRRPKPFPWLKMPRAQARWRIRRHRHRLCA